MPRSTRITQVDRQGPRRTLIRYRGGGEKGEIEITGGMPELRQWIRGQIADSHELLVALALRQWLEQNPNSTDFSAIEGKTITLDFAAANILTVTA